MIKYIKQEMSPLNSNGKQDCFYRTERHGNMTHNDLVQQMSLGGMTKPQAEMALARLKESMTELLLLGYSVSIDGLGCFNLSLGTKDEKDVEEMDGDVRRNAASLKVRKVLFRTDRKWLSNLNLQCRFERGGVSRIQKSHLAVEQRLAKAQEFIAEHHILRIAEYARLTGLSKSLAARELRFFADATSTTGITFEGRGPSLVYVAAQPTTVENQQEKI